MKITSAIRKAIGFVVFSISIFAPIYSNAVEMLEDKADQLTPGILVTPPARSISKIDPVGYEAFKSQYKHRRKVVYFVADDGALLELDVDQDPIRVSDGEFSVNYYVFDAKIFDENSISHPYGWGTLLVTSMRGSCLIFDVTNPENVPVLISEFKLASRVSCTAKPTALTLPDRFGDNIVWYLAFGSGEGAKIPEIYLYNLHTMTVDRKISVNSRLLLKKHGQESYVGGITAADIDQDGLTDVLYFGTVEKAKSQSNGSLYSLTFTRGLDREDKNLVFLERYIRPPLAKIFQANGPIRHQPLVKVGPDGVVWLFLSSDSSIYGLKESFSRRLIKLSRSNVRNKQRQDWYHKLPKVERFTTGITDLRGVLAINSFHSKCNDCPDKGFNKLRLYHAFSGEEIEELLDDENQTRKPTRDLLEEVEGFPKKRLDKEILNAKLLSRLALDKRETPRLEDRLTGIEISDGIRRLSWWQQ